MSSSLEEKILDGPRIHYCDADDDDIRKDDEQDQASENDGETDGFEKRDIADLFRPITEEDEKFERLESVNWVPSSSNTGPKGVIGDYLKRRKNAKSNKANRPDNRLTTEEDKLDLEFEELLNDESLIQEFISKRISLAQKSEDKTFGDVLRLESGEQLLSAIDDENPNILVIVHIFTNHSRACYNLNRCLDKIAREYANIKFVSLNASATTLSNNFKENGVPALLAYKSGNLVTSLVQLEELLDPYFEPQEVKELLFDRGLITDLR